VLPSKLPKGQVPSKTAIRSVVDLSVGIFGGKFCGAPLPTSPKENLILFS